MQQKPYWLGFNLVRGIGSVRFRKVLDYFGDPQSAWRAPIGALAAAGLPAKCIETLVEIRKKVNPEEIYETTVARGIQVWTWDDPEYPPRLAQIDQPPPVIYVRGTLTAQDDPAVAIVGTRRATAYGRQVAQQMATALAENGVTVVSGLALGIDAAAHMAALQAGGRTLAVLGCGVDRVYPPEHRALTERVIASGAIVSDYAPGTPPESANFPPRNRIIAGLAAATVVVEASERSGALITATFAAEQGREVFGVPGSILSPQSQGVNRLIQQGAAPYLKPEDVLEALSLRNAAARPQQATLQMPGDEKESRILALLSDAPVHLDDLCTLSGLSIDQVSATLTMLELKGLARSTIGMRYILVR